MRKTNAITAALTHAGVTCARTIRADINFTEPTKPVKVQGAAILNGDRMPNVHADEKQQWVDFAPPELINRQYTEWQGLRADVVTAVRKNPFDYTFNSPQHLLIAAEQSEREDGETLVEGLPRSTLRNLSGRLTFVPAGHKFYGWQIRAYSRA